MAETIPPPIGAAMRRIVSEPVPLPHMIGSSPAMMAVTVSAMNPTPIATPLPAVDGEAYRHPRHHEVTSNAC